LDINNAFLLHCVNPAALLRVRCYSICLPLRVASWVNYSAGNELNRPVSSTPVISACWRLLHYDVEVRGACIWTHDLWIQKGVCYPHYTTAPHIESRSVAAVSHCSFFNDSPTILKFKLSANRILLVWCLLIWYYFSIS